MRSLIIIEVEHGEDTDGLDQYIADCLSEAEYDDVVNVLDWTIRVDLPACFHMNPVDGLIPTFEGN